MQRGDCVVEWVVAHIEGGVHPVMVEQCLHLGNPGGGHLDVEEEVVGDRDGVDEEVVQGHLVGHVPLAGVGVVDGCDIDEKQVDEEVVEVQKRGQSGVLKGLLNPKYGLTLNGVYPIGPMAGGSLDGLVQPVSDALPDDDDDVASHVQVVALVVDHLADS